MKNKGQKIASSVRPSRPSVLPWFMLAYVSLLLMIGMSIIGFRDWSWLYVFFWRSGWTRLSAWGMSALVLAPLWGAVAGATFWTMLGVLLWNYVPLRTWFDKRARA